MAFELTWGVLLAIVGIVGLAGKMGWLITKAKHKEYAHWALIILAILVGFGWMATSGSLFSF